MGEALKALLRLRPLILDVFRGKGRIKYGRTAHVLLSYGSSIHFEIFEVKKTANGIGRGRKEWEFLQADRDAW
jgi:hypothetical protein